MNSHHRKLGSTLIVAGTAIGAGMLALPLATSGLGYPLIVALLLSLWTISLYSGLILLDINLTIGAGHTLYTMAESILGNTGKITAVIATLVLYYAATAAYIDGGSELLINIIDHAFAIQISKTTTSILFALCGGYIIFHSTSLVDLINRGLFAVMLLAFGLVILLLASGVNTDFILASPVSPITLLQRFQLSILRSVFKYVFQAWSATMVPEAKIHGQIYAGSS